MKALLIAMLATAAADAASTCHALRSGQFVEANPLMPGASCGRVVMLKAATVAPLAIVLPRLAKTRPRLARALAIVPTSTAGVAVVLNLRAMKGVGP
jgi:hypothetical protein